jgi:hypothetical protein
LRGPFGAEGTDGLANFPQHRIVIGFSLSCRFFNRLAVPLGFLPGATQPLLYFGFQRIFPSPISRSDCVIKSYADFG